MTEGIRLTFDLAAPPIDPPEQCRDLVMWAAALELAAGHQGEGGRCADCGMPSPCDGARLAWRGLATACGVETDESPFWRDLSSIIHPVG
jgi:hypothetical protein